VSAPTRRQLLLTGAATALGAVMPRGRLLAQAPAAAQALGPNLYLVSAAGVNAVARTTGDGALLVDGGSTASSRAVLDLVAALPGSGAVHTLFNTHWHPEQTGSNAELGAAGARIIAQENTRLWLTTDITYPWDESQRFDPLPKIAQPNDSFYDDGELDSGIRYGYLRHAAHTDGDLYVYFPEDNVLAVGNAVYGKGWPFVDWWTGGWIGGIVGTLELVLSLMNDATRVVPAVGPTLGVADIQQQFQMYNEIFTRLQTMLNNGFGPEDVLEAKPTAEYDAVMGPSEIFIRRAFESLWAYLSPDA